jgi:DNA-binding GntR family transcriptional regulator
VSELPAVDDGGGRAGPPRLAVMSAAPVAPIRREAAPLRTQAVDYLRNAIVTGAFPPGSRLVEKRMCDELGVSRTVVRESLRQLESERLVDMLPNVGPVVHTLTRREAAGLYEVRGALEALAGRSAATHAAPEQVERLRAVVARIAATTGPMADLLALKNEFYAALVDASGNPTIGELFGNIQARISELRSLSLSHPGRPAAMVDELERVVEAIGRGDADEAARRCQAHVENAAALALGRLADP